MRYCTSQTQRCPRGPPARRRRSSGGRSRRARSKRPAARAPFTRGSVDAVPRIGCAAIGARGVCREVESTSDAPRSGKTEVHRGWDAAAHAPAAANGAVALGQALPRGPSAGGPGRPQPRARAGRFTGRNGARARHPLDEACTTRPSEMRINVIGKGQANLARVVHCLFAGGV